MFQSFKKTVERGFRNIVSDLTTITPLEKQIIAKRIEEEPLDSTEDERKVYTELPLNYLKKNDNQDSANSTYTYRNNHDYRYREFNYLSDELNQHYDCRGTKTIVLCIFVFNDSCSFDGEPYPFLQFLAQKGETTLQNTFPSFVFECPENLDDEQLQIHFTNNCLHQVLDFFVMEGGKLHDYTTENISKTYRGLIENDDFVYVAYDMTNFMKLPMRPSKRSEWCILHELMDPSLTDSGVIDFFEKYPYMSVINSDTVVRYPICLYLYDVVEREHMIRDKSMALLEPRSYHPRFGNFYYLVEDCPSDKACRKCAVFMENNIELNTGVMNRRRSERLYSEPDGNSSYVLVENSMDDMDEYIEDDPVADSYLEELEQEVDGEESPKESQEEPLEESVKESQEEPLEESVKESQEELPKESVKESQEELPKESVKESQEEQPEQSYPFTSIIAFNENNTNIWCVKTQSLFTEL
jgi:hypothetical protein